MYIYIMVSKTESLVVIRETILQEFNPTPKHQVGGVVGGSSWADGRRELPTWWQGIRQHWNFGRRENLIAQQLEIGKAVGSHRLSQVTL